MFKRRVCVYIIPCFTVVKIEKTSQETTLKRFQKKVLKFSP